MQDTVKRSIVVGVVTTYIVYQCIHTAFFQLLPGIAVSNAKLPADLGWGPKRWVYLYSIWGLAGWLV